MHSQFGHLMAQMKNSYSATQYTLSSITHNKKELKIVLSCLSEVQTEYVASMFLLAACIYAQKCYA